MRRGLGVALALAVARCTCSPLPVFEQTYACRSDGDCADGFTCVANRCSSSSGAGGGAGGGAAGGGGGGAGGLGTGGGQATGGGTGGTSGGTGGTGGGAGGTSGGAGGAGGCGPCLTPVHATARCAQGVCARTACDPTWFDLDGPATFGCETQCLNGVCTAPDGGVTPVSADPVPESRAVAEAFAAGSSLGPLRGIGPAHTNFGVLGESGLSGAGESNGTAHRNLGGFTSQLRRPEAP